MKFIYKAYHPEITDEDLIADLQRVQRELNCLSLSIAEYDAIGNYNSSTVSRRFNSWNKALKQAGIGVRNEFFEEVDLFENIQNVWQSKGKQPTRRDMDEHPESHISSGAYLRKFGKWSQALIAFVEYMNGDNRLEEDQQHCTSDEQAHKTKRDINSRLRFLVLARDNFSCRACGASPAKDGGITRLHVDHIIPWSKGGETIIDNLQTLCEKCNLGKSNIEV